jgi:hypothetical protein
MGGQPPDPTKLDWVFELAVAALLRDLIPAIVFNQFQHVTNFHANCSILIVIIAPIEIQFSFPIPFCR